MMSAMMKNLILIVGLIAFAIGCDIKENNVEPDRSFTKIYNNQEFSRSYDPLRVIETSDSGYLAIAATFDFNSEDTWWSPYLIKVDENGDYQWEITLEEPYVNPVPYLTEKTDGYYFFTMDEVGLYTYLMRLGFEGTNPEVVATFTDIEYPLSANLTPVEDPNPGILVQGYQRGSFRTTLTKLDTEFNQLWTQEYDVLEDAEPLVINHLTRLGQEYPFFSGFVQGTGNRGNYFFNGFRNFSFSLNFVDASNGEITGAVNGSRYKGGLSAALHLGGDQFALSKFSFGENFFVPSAPVNINGEISSTSITANRFPELLPDARVLVKELTLPGKEVYIYGTDTKSNQMVLYAYDKATSELLGVTYVGQTNPYTLGDYIVTEDNGLLLLGETFVAGRFPRLAMFKLTEEELAELVNP